MSGLGGLLDRYLARRFLATYGLCLLGFVLLFVVVDFAGKLEDFLEAREDQQLTAAQTWGLVAEFYLSGVPAKMTILGPFLTLFATIATMITFGRNNELVPMLVAGRSVHRVLLPIYVMALVVVGLLVSLEEWVGPVAHRRHLAADREIDGRDAGAVDRLPHLRDGQNAYVADVWYPGDQRLVGLRCPRFVDPGGKLPVGSLVVGSLEYRVHGGVQGWYPRDAELVPAETDADGRTIPAIRLPLTEPLGFDFAPDEVNVLAAEGRPSSLTRGQLRQLLAEHPRQHNLRMEMYSRTTRPLASFILLLLGLPFVSTPGRKSIAAGLTVALGTCASYFGSEFLCQELGAQGGLQPLVAAWLTPSLFGAVAIARLTRV